MAIWQQRERYEGRAEILTGSGDVVTVGSVRLWKVGGRRVRWGGSILVDREIHDSSYRIRLATGEGTAYMSLSEIAPPDAPRSFSLLIDGSGDAPF